MSKDVTRVPTKSAQPAYLNCMQDNVGQSVSRNKPFAGQLGRGLSWTLLLSSTTQLLCHCLHTSSAAAAAAAAFSCASCCTLCFLGCTSTYERKDGRHSGQRCAEIWQKQTKISTGADVTAVTQSKQYATSSFALPVYSQARTPVLSRREPCGCDGCMTDRHVALMLQRATSIRVTTLLRVPSQFSGNLVNQPAFHRAVGQSTNVKLAWDLPGTLSGYCCVQLRSCQEQVQMTSCADIVSCINIGHPHRHI